MTTDPPNYKFPPERICVRWTTRGAERALFAYPYTTPGDMETSERLYLREDIAAAKVEAFAAVHANAVRVAVAQAIKDEQEAVLAYVTGWVRKQFKDRVREGLGPEDAYDDVREFIKKRAAEAAKKATP